MQNSTASHHDLPWMSSQKQETNANLASWFGDESHIQSLSSAAPTTFVDTP